MSGITIRVEFDEDLEALFPKITEIFEGLSGSQVKAKSDDNEILTVEEAAELLRVKKSKIYSLTMQKGPDSIPRFKVGRDLRFKKTELIEWCENNAG